MNKKKILLLIAGLFILVCGLSIYALQKTKSGDTQQAGSTTSVTDGPSEKTPEAPAEKEQITGQEKQAEKTDAPVPGTDTEQAENENPAVTPEGDESDPGSAGDQEKTPAASDGREQTTERETQKETPHSSNQDTDTEQWEDEIPALPPEGDEGDPGSAGDQGKTPAASDGTKQTTEQETQKEAPDASKPDSYTEQWEDEIPALPPEGDEDDFGSAGIQENNAAKPSGTSSQGNKAAGSSGNSSQGNKTENSSKPAGSGPSDTPDPPVTETPDPSAESQGDNGSGEIEENETSMMTDF